MSILSNYTMTRDSITFVWAVFLNDKSHCWFQMQCVEVISVLYCAHLLLMFVYIKCNLFCFFTFSSNVKFEIIYHIISKNDWLEASSSKDTISYACHYWRVFYSRKWPLTWTKYNETTNILIYSRCPFIKKLSYFPRYSLVKNNHMIETKTSLFSLPFSVLSYQFKGMLLITTGFLYCVIHVIEIIGKIVFRCNFIIRNG